MFAKKHKGLNTMIKEKSIKCYCCEDISLIENYQEALISPKKYQVHHRLELHPDGSVRFSSKSLKTIGLYYKRPACELIFIERSAHRKLHTQGKAHPLYKKKGKSNPKFGVKHKNTQNQKKPHSIFGIKYYNHFNMVRSDNLHQYSVEYGWWHDHGKNKCSWEV